MCAAHKTSAGILGASGLALAVMVLAGCAPDPAPQAAPAAPAAPSPSVADSATTVTWMNGFCGVVREFIDGNNKMTAGGGDSVEAIKQSTSDQLGYYKTLLSKTVDGLTALPAGPVPAGETAKKDFLGKYSAARDKAANAKADLDASAKSDTAAQGRAVEGLIAAQKEAHSALDPVKAVLDSPELTKAAATAERCRP
ncbi:hypothetical protein [Amycolatopsis pittospori]|uniref:hypothetical protein n=1 Tax=Amycolatopsis pittospori TaxID=2749434 RepID=UPI0015F0177F|nr:hypothetical protein [Amycolatopsis pittospori]